MAWWLFQIKISWIESAATHFYGLTLNEKEFWSIISMNWLNVAWSVLLLARPHTDLTCFLMRKNVSLLITANDSMFEKCIKESELHAECEWEKIIYEFYNLAFNTIQHINKLYTTIFASFSRCAILKKLLNNNWNARYEPSEITVMMARM